MIQSSRNHLTVLMRIIFFLFSVCEYEYTVLTTSPSVSLYWIRLMGWVVRINLLVISHIYTVCSSRTFLKSTSRYAMSPFILFFSPYVLFIILKIDVIHDNFMQDIIYNKSIMETFVTRDHLAQEWCRHSL